MIVCTAVALANDTVVPPNENVLSWVGPPSLERTLPDTTLVPLPVPEDNADSLTEASSSRAS